MKSLLPDQIPEQITLADALQLLSLPRTVGTDAATGEPVVADLGRFGPYIKRGKDTRTLPSAGQLFTLTMEEADALFAQEKPGRRGGSTLLKSLGKHPESDSEINLMSGRYGPYVTDGSLNASVPRATDPDNVNLADAIALLAERAAKGPAKRGRGKSASASGTARRGRPKKTKEGTAAASPKKPVLRKRRDRHQAIS